PQPRWSYQHFLSARQQLLLSCLLRFLFCDTRQNRQLFKVLPGWTSWGSPENDSSATNDLFAGNASLRSQYYAIFYAYVIGNSYLPANDRIGTYPRSARDAGLRGNHHILTYLNIVSYVH